MQQAYHIDETDDLSGPMSVKFKPGSPIDEFCAGKIPGYTVNRYNVLALRMYYGKEIIITVYAVDKEHLGKPEYEDGKIPVKKFKLENVHLMDLLPFIDECNFTLSTGDYAVDNMVVINK